MGELLGHRCPTRSSSGSTVHEGDPAAIRAEGIAIAAELCEELLDRRRARAALLHAEPVQGDARDLRRPPDHGLMDRTVRVHRHRLGAGRPRPRRPAGHRGATARGRGRRPGRCGRRERAGRRAGRGVRRGLARSAPRRLTSGRPTTTRDAARLRGTARPDHHLHVTCDRRRAALDALADAVGDRLRVEGIALRRARTPPRDRASARCRRRTTTRAPGRNASPALAGAGARPGRSAGPEGGGHGGGDAIGRLRRDRRRPTVGRSPVRRRSRPV